MPRYPSFPMNGIVIVFWLAAAQAQLRPHFRNDQDFVLAHLEEMVEDHGYQIMGFVFDAVETYTRVYTCA